ncbi:hypothetical protein ACFU8I_29475 [Streptomyces sp. NPDC057540]
MTVLASALDTGGPDYASHRAAMLEKRAPPAPAHPPARARGGAK